MKEAHCSVAQTNKNKVASFRLTCVFASLSISLMSRSFTPGQKKKGRFYALYLGVLLVYLQPRELFFKTFNKVNDILVSSIDTIRLARDRLGLRSRDNHGTRVDLDNKPKLLVSTDLKVIDCGARDWRGQLGTRVRRGHC